MRKPQTYKEVLDYARSLGIAHARMLGCGGAAYFKLIVYHECKRLGLNHLTGEKLK